MSNVLDENLMLLCLPYGTVLWLNFKMLARINMPIAFALSRGMLISLMHGQNCSMWTVASIFRKSWTPFSVIF